MKRVYLVTATKAKTEEDFSKRPIFKSLKKYYELYSRDEFEFEVVKGNSNGLPTVYNRYLTEEHKGDIVLFVHDDVIINDLFLVDHLNKSPWAVTGLAGASVVSLEADKCAWHIMSKPDTRKGEVKHIKQGTVWTTVFGPSDGAVTVIDGLFIAVDIEKILQRGVKFNEEFDFHHYDISFCLDCVNSSLSVGVLPINVIHYGLGDSMLTPEWEESNKKFKNAYCNQNKSV